MFSRKESLLQNSDQRKHKLSMLQQDGLRLQPCTFYHHPFIKYTVRFNFFFTFLELKVSTELKFIIHPNRVEANSEINDTNHRNIFRSLHGTARGGTRFLGGGKGLSSRVKNPKSTTGLAKEQNLKIYNILMQQIEI